MSNNPKKIGENLHYTAWISFSKQGAMKITKGPSKCRANERRIKVAFSVPETIFVTPELSVQIEFDGDFPTPNTVELRADVQNILDDAGFNVEVTSKEPESENPQ